MVGMLQSFRSSSMPKRLLRYALSRLELLDSDALDLANLDLALGRNTVFEFRDVGIKLKKLEDLLKLPQSLSLQKAKVLRLRVTVPMDFYTSPITIDLDGVDVKVKVLGPEKLKTGQKSTAKSSPEDTSPLLDTVDVAQSFLEAQPSSERKKLEEALAADTQDLVASASMMSDDNSEEEPALGTGQPLSVPTFLANFLQGVLDRMQIRINDVAFQLDVEVPVDMNSPNTEPVSFQIALQDIDIEGVTTQADDAATSSTILPKEGKRQVSLANIRAYLISEADIFPNLTRSPSLASPSIASSPFMTRNPPSRQATFVSQYESEQKLKASCPDLHEHLSQTSQGGFHGEAAEGKVYDEAMASSQSTFREHLTGRESSFEPQYPVADSEETLGIPFNLLEHGRDDENEGPATPRASVHSEAVQAHEIPESSRQALQGFMALSLQSPESVEGSGSGTSDDLSQSQIYTHEEAESMYMSAFSGSGISPSFHAPLRHEQQRSLDEGMQGHEAREQQLPDTSRHSSEKTPVQSPRLSPQTTAHPLLPSESPDLRLNSPISSLRGMPGGWDDDDYLEATNRLRQLGKEVKAASSLSSPAFSRVSPAEIPPIASDSADQGDAATPRGTPRVVKEILRLQNISIYVPSQFKKGDAADSVVELARSMGASASPQAPGAFTAHRGPEVKEDPKTPSNDGLDDTIEIDLSPVSVRVDASIAFVLAMIMGKLLEAVKDDRPSPPKKTEHEKEEEEDKTDSRLPDMKIAVQEISLDFLNLLGGVVDGPQRHLDPAAFMFEHEVLLNATLGGLAVSVSSTETSARTAGRSRSAKQMATTTKIDLQRFRFGYANGDIVSFDHVKPMNMSIRDTFLSNDHDIGIKIMQTKDSIKTDIETLPLSLQIDLQRLDETFSWFGGLSSFLNMSTSMTSTPGLTPKAAAAAPALKPKGVRFDTPINPEDKSAASENKVNVRIGGAFVELLGKECSVVAESNAIKLVSREEGIGMACSMMRLSGPLLIASSAEPAIQAEIGGVRLDFLSTPKDSDLEKLLELIMPSNDIFDQRSDEIMVDTLLRQRRKGSVLRTNVETVSVRVKNLSQLSALPGLAEEMAKLATVAKYLPEDDRPGLLTLAKIQKLGVSADMDGKIGHLSGELLELELGHISVPSLVAIAVSGVSLRRNRTEELISSSSLFSPPEVVSRGPVVMARMIGDEIEPIIRLRFQDVSIEYRVPTIMDILGLGSEATPQDFEESLAASVVNLGDQAHNALARQPSSSSVELKQQKKPMTLDVAFRDCLIGLNPLNQQSKLVIALTDAGLEVVLPRDEVTKATLHVNKASILLTDDASQSGREDSPTGTRRRSSSAVSPQVVELSMRGFVDICYLSSAMVAVHIAPGPEGDKQVEVEVRDDLLVLETCADSTQTLIALANGLSPPTPPSKENKYRTNVVPVQDLLASISAEAFGRPEGEYDFDQDFAGAQELAGSGSGVGHGVDNGLRVESQFYGDDEGEELFDAFREDSTMQDTREGVLITNNSASYVSDGDDLIIHDNFYNQGNTKTHTAKVWNSRRNTFDRAPDEVVKSSPLKVSVRDVHVIWNLFDGYDWTHTREVISKAVQDVEAKAYERQARLSGAQQAYEEELEDGETIGDFLFNSIYIGIPANRDPMELSKAINEGLYDAATETESLAPTTVTTTTSRTSRRPHPKPRRLRLQRSRHHKITFELHGVNVDMIAYADAGQTMSSIDVKVKNLDIFDHVPTSTWKKFATYDQDKGEREMGTSMVHLQLLTVRPIPQLGASEIILKANVLPLRLHVDQDALDFITRFFEFKDESVSVPSSPSDVPFLQRAEVHDISVKLDFKPKRVDYAGLRSGHTTEFMNFIVLEESRMVLRHVIIYGVSGFERLGRTLQDIWTPDVRNNQLPGVIAGLAPVRSLVNIGSGFRDLVEIPLREYKKDGRVIRSISKGAAAFARTTGTELVKFGAKLAVGTQYALQGAEELLTEQQPHQQHYPGGGVGGWEDDDDDMEPEERRQISLYADQPTGVIQGLRGGYRSLARDVNLARDAIIAVPGEVMESSSPAGAARAVMRRAPTIIFRPALGVTRAIGQTLMGATNSMDPHNQRRIDEKYKKH